MLVIGERISVRVFKTVRVMVRVSVEFISHTNSWPDLMVQVFTVQIQPGNREVPGWLRGRPDSRVRGGINGEYCLDRQNPDVPKDPRVRRSEGWGFSCCFDDFDMNNLWTTLNHESIVRIVSTFNSLLIWNLVYDSNNDYEESLECTVWIPSFDVCRCTSVTGS